MPERIVWREGKHRYEEAETLNSTAGRGNRMGVGPWRASLLHAQHTGRDALPGPVAVYNVVDKKAVLELNRGRKSCGTEKSS